MYSSICLQKEWALEMITTYVTCIIMNRYGHCPAIISELPQGGQKVLTFGQLKQDSDRLAATLSSKFGIQRRDRVAILLTQTPQTVVFHVAIYKLGAIAIPLFTQFGNDAIKFRLVNSETRALVTDREDLKKIEEILSELPNLELVIVTEWGQSVEYDSSPKYRFFAD